MSKSNILTKQLSSLIDKKLRKELTSAQILEIYASRMHIEELFRDFKNHRFGWSLRTARTRSTCRYAIMILIALLSYFIVMMVGISMEKAGEHLKLQSNSLKSRRVLSLFFLGKEAVRLGFYKFCYLRFAQIIELVRPGIYSVCKRPSRDVHRQVGLERVTDLIKIGSNHQSQQNWSAVNLAE